MLPIRQTFFINCLLSLCYGDHIADTGLRPGGTYSMNTNDPGMQFQIQFNGVTGGDKVSFDNSTIAIYRLSEFGTSKEIKLSNLIPMDVDIIRKALTNSVLTNGNTKLSKPEMAAALSLFDKQLQLARPPQNKLDLLK